MENKEKEKVDLEIVGIMEMEEMEEKGTLDKGVRKPDDYKRKRTIDAVFDDDEEGDELNSDDDVSSLVEDEDDHTNGGDDWDNGNHGTERTLDYIVCTHEKVSHTKERWRALLCNGVLHIAGRDYVFRKLKAQRIFE